MKQIKNYPDYFVDEFCNVFSKRVWQGNLKGELRLLKPGKASHGYLTVNLFANGIQRNFPVHRLVAEAFIPNPENKRCVNHIDGDKLNNQLDNLEWCTHKENTAHAVNLGLITQLLIKPKAIYQCDKEGNTIAEFISGCEAARVTGIDQRHISDVCRGKRKTAGGSVWVFASS